MRKSRHRKVTLPNITHSPGPERHTDASGAQRVTVPHAASTHRPWRREAKLVRPLSRKNCFPLRIQREKNTDFKIISFQVFLSSFIFLRMKVVSQTVLGTASELSVPQKLFQGKQRSGQAPRTTLRRRHHRGGVAGKARTAHLPLQTGSAVPELRWWLRARRAQTQPRAKRFPPHLAPAIYPN